MSVVLPIFPLNTVVFPGQQLPLHIFEPRYRKLVRDVLDADGEFGIALIRQGREVGGGAEPVEIGCCVRIADVQELPNGRFNLSCVGTRRFRLTESLGEDPYLRARVEFPPPPADAGDEEIEEVAEEVAALYREHLQLTLALHDGWQRRIRCPADPIELADTAAATVDAPVGVKQEILAADRLATRLEGDQRLLRKANRGIAEQLAVRRRYKLGGLGARN